MSDKWEIVVKGGKHKQKSQISPKELKQIKENNLNGNRYNRNLDDETDESISPELTKISRSAKIKSKLTTKVDNDNNMSQKINKLSGETIKSVQKELTEKFPSQPTVVLMDLAVHINIMLKINEESLKSISFDNFDFPYALLSNDTISSLRSVFTNLNNVQLGNFLKSAAIQFIDDNEKGVKSIGLLILLQVCLRMKPTSLIANRKSMFDLFNLNRENMGKFKCLIWLLKQACVNFNIACQIWLIYLLPFISQKCHTENVLQFGEEIISYGTEVGGNDSVLLHTDFLPIIDLLYNQATYSDTITNKKTKKKPNMMFQLSQIHLGRLSDIYDKIKEHVFQCTKTQSSLKDYFASFYVRLSLKNKNEQFNKELLDCMDSCLTLCTESLKQLDHLYQSYPLQSKIFLEHISSGKSTAATLVMKQKSYRTNIDKIKNATLAPKAAVSTKAKLPKSQSSTSFCGTFFKLFFYIILLLLSATLLIRSQYPQHYNGIVTKVSPAIAYCSPYYELLKLRTLTAYKTAQPFIVEIADKIARKSVQFWLIVKPFVENGIEKAEIGGKYIYGKMNEIAPHLLEKVGHIYVSVADFVADSHRDFLNYLNGPQFTEMVKSLSDKTASVAEQAQNSYRNVVTYMLRVVGY